MSDDEETSCLGTPREDWVGEGSRRLLAEQFIAQTKQRLIAQMDDLLEPEEMGFCILKNK